MMMLLCDLHVWYAVYIGIIARKLPLSAEEN